MKVRGGFEIRRAILPLLCLSACDPAAQGGFLGNPQATIQGTVGGATPNQRPRSPHLGVAWLLSTTCRGAVIGDVAQVTTMTFPARFTFGVFDKPPAEAIMTRLNPDGSVESEIAFAYIIAFDDTNEDRQFQMATDQRLRMDPPDQIIGVAWSHALLFVKASPPAGVTPIVAGRPIGNPQALGPGFRLIRLDCLGPTASGTLTVVDLTTPVPITAVPPSSETPQAPPGTCLLGTD